MLRRLNETCPLKSPPSSFLPSRNPFCCPSTLERNPRFNEASLKLRYATPDKILYEFSFEKNQALFNIPTVQLQKRVILHNVSHNASLYYLEI